MYSISVTSPEVGKRKDPHLVQVRRTKKTPPDMVLPSSRRFTTRKEAEAYKRELEKARDLIPIVGVLHAPVSASAPPVKPPVSESAVDGDMDFYTFGGSVIKEYSEASPEVIAGYLRHIERLKEANQINVKVKDLKLQHATKALNWIAKQKGADGKSKISYETVKGCKTVLRMITKMAYENELIASDVFSGIKIPKTTKPKVQRSVIEPDVWAKVVAEAEKTDNLLFAYLTLMKGTGMRPSEARCIAWSSLDFSKSKIYIFEAVKFGREGEDGIGCTKTEKARTTILLPAVADVLKAFKEKQEAELGACKRVFTVPPKGEFITKNGMLNRFRRVMAKLVEDGSITERDKFSFYNIRHTVITDYVRAGMPIAHIAEVVGNSVEIIQKTYNHMGSDDVVEQMKKLLGLV
jgi:integrase